MDTSPAQPTPQKPVPEEAQKPPHGSRPAGTTAQKPETTPAQERGERIDTGKTIARGGKTTGHVPGATPSS